MAGSGAGAMAPKPAEAMLDETMVEADYVEVSAMQALGVNAADIAKLKVRPLAQSARAGARAARSTSRVRGQRPRAAPRAPAGSPTPLPPHHICPHAP